MHRLLGRVLRERDQANGQWPDTVGAALDLLQPELFPEAEAWARREAGRHLTGQIEALWEADGAGASSPGLALRQLQARSWAVRQLQAAAGLSSAIDLGAQAMADCERVLGADHPDALASRNNLAGAVESAGRLGEAIPLYERALAERERVLGADHPDTVATRASLERALNKADPG